MTNSNVPPIVSVADFRILRSAFVNPKTYPNALIQHYLTLAAANLPWDRWQTLYVEGTLDYVAHFIVINQRNAQASERGAIPGNAVGRLTSKSVGGVSVNYAVGDTDEQDGGFWNVTTYGSSLLRNARMVGAGGAQLGGCYVGPPNNGPAWPGPPLDEFLPSSAF